MSQFDNLLSLLNRMKGGTLQQEGNRASLELEDSSYDFYYDDNNQAVLLEVVIAELDSELSLLQRGYICKRLLKAQLNFAESEGFAFGLTPDEKYISLQCLKHADSLAEQECIRIFDSFVKEAKLWEQKLASITQATAMNQPEVPEGMVTGMMRV